MIRPRVAPNFRRSVTRHIASLTRGGQPIDVRSEFCFSDPLFSSDQQVIAEFLARLILKALHVELHEIRFHCRNATVSLRGAEGKDIELLAPPLALGIDTMRALIKEAQLADREAASLVFNTKPNPIHVMVSHLADPQDPIISVRIV